jgi:hypothetical protein
MADPKRLHYFHGQFLRESDFNDEQGYQLQLERDHGRLLHTPGIAEGLDIDPPSALNTPSVTITAGTAYDDLGQRISLGGDVTQSVSALPDGTVFVTISYDETQTDSVLDTGTEGNTRWTESPKIQLKGAAPASNRELLLAKVTVAAGKVIGVDRTDRIRAGVKAGDLALTTLTVNGDIVVTGKVDGRDVGADGASLIAHLGNTSNPHATTAAQIGALPTGGGTVTGNLQVNGNLGIGTAPTGRLVVAAGDEADNITVAGQFSAVTSSPSTTDTMGVAVFARSSGGGATGLITSAAGGAIGQSVGLSAAANGDGSNVAGVFYAQSTVDGDCLGIRSGGFSTGGAGAVGGASISADGAGTGAKIAIDASATGEGQKTGLNILAQTNVAASAATTKGIHVVANSAGTGAVTGAHLQTSGPGPLIGLQSQTSGDDLNTAGIFDASSFNAASAQPVKGLDVTATSAGSGAVTGALISVGGSGSGAKVGLTVTVNAGGAGPLAAAVFNGNVVVNGILRKAGGGFTIDDPRSPLDKLLTHHFVESPEEICLYRGMVRLDGNGKGVVEMPNYFAILTKEEEATVTLTPVGRQGFLVGYEWNKKFTAFTVHGEAEREVSYLVLACRDDPTIRVLRRPVEEDKRESDRGQLLCPQAYPDLGKRGGKSARSPEVPSVPDLKAEAEAQRKEHEAILHAQRARDQEHRHALDRANASRQPKKGTDK